MAKSHYVFKNGAVIFAIEDGEIKVNDLEQINDPGYHVIKDCDPFISMIDGSIIHSKSHYREHLRQHGCIEVGNDSSLTKTRKPLVSPPGLKETIIRLANEKLR